MSGLELKYFVLKPHGDTPFARASRAAMERYAQWIETEDLDLAQQLREWIEKEQIGDESIRGSLNPDLTELQDELKMQSDATMAAAKESTEYRMALTHIWTIANHINLDPTERMKEIKNIARNALVLRK